MREVVIMMLATNQSVCQIMCVCFDWMTCHFFFEDLSVLIWVKCFCQCLVTSLSTCVRECAWEFTLLGHLRWPLISISLFIHTLWSAAHFIRAIRTVPLEVAPLGLRHALAAPAPARVLWTRLVACSRNNRHHHLSRHPHLSHHRYLNHNGVWKTRIWK